MLGCIDSVYTLVHWVGVYYRLVCWVAFTQYSSCMVYWVNVCRTNWCTEWDHRKHNIPRISPKLSSVYLWGD